MKKEYITPETIEMRLASAVNIMEASDVFEEEVETYDEYTESNALSKGMELDLWQE